MKIAPSSCSILAATLLLAGCLSATTFKTYEDGGARYVGRGGAKEIVEGVEIWSEGSPPRAYQVVGLIEDTRRKAAIPMASFKKDVATAIKANGGAAGIILSQGLQQLGTYAAPAAINTRTTATATSLGGGRYSINSTSAGTVGPTYGIAISDQITTIAVIRYVEAP